MTRTPENKVLLNTFLNTYNIYYALMTGITSVNNLINNY